MEILDEFYLIDDFFDPNTRIQLLNECNKQFKYNILVSDYIEVTNSILDCHGLALSDDKYFPYSTNCWNIFVLKIKEYVSQYCFKYGYDESTITPFSCWAERSKSCNIDSFFDSPSVVEDFQITKHFIRTVYTLVNFEPKYGTTIVFDDENTISIRSNENRLLIYDGIKYKSTQHYSSKYKKYNIIFDWYVNIPFDVPDWILP